MAPAAATEDDPISAEYDVFITPELEEKLYLLQFPTRERGAPYNDQEHNRPLEMRIKPLTGFVEIDVPISTDFYYNRQRAKQWGKALGKSKVEGANGYGLAAGFLNASGLRTSRPKPVRTGGRAGDPGGHLDHSDDDQEEHLMQHQTLGGQISKDEPGKPVYMVGAFRGEELHLTKLEGIVQMRPQFHHIDAKTQADRNKNRREKEAFEAPRTVEPRVVQMMMKPTDGENMDASSTKDLLQAAQDESWTKLQFHDEEAEEAYIMYNEKLFFEDTASAPQLQSSLTNEEYLDAISAPRIDPNGRTKTKARSKRKRVMIDIPGTDDDDDEIDAEPGAQEDQVAQKAEPSIE